MSSSQIVLPPANGVCRIKLESSNDYLELQDNNTVNIGPLKTTGTKQLWNITSVATGANSAYKITSFDKGLVLTLQQGSGSNAYVVCQGGASTTWKIESQGLFSELGPFDGTYKGSVLDREDSSGRATLSSKTSSRTYQHWVFELTEYTFESRFFTLTPEEAKKQGPYDIIIIGSGFGGGVLAADLFETNHKIGQKAQKILVLEKGKLIFHTNCLNAARPTGDRTGRDQFNHTFYSRFKSEFNITPQSEDWEGGPVYGVGGRSAIWSLAAPRIHDRTLAAYFPKPVVDELLKEYYQKAERVLSLFLPRTRPEHQEYMDRLNLTADGSLDVAWQWARIASEFRDEANNFDFARGAFSSIDKLLEIAMNKPVDEHGQRKEHENFKILLGAEAREIIWDTANPTKPSGVRVKTLEGTFDFNLRQDGKVVVSAGSVHSAAILLRSNVDLGKMGGLHITDHNILFKNRSYRYRNPSDRTDIKAMKLQTYLNLLPVDVHLTRPSSSDIPSVIDLIFGALPLGLPDSDSVDVTGYKDLTLVNLYVDSSPFLYRGDISIPSNDVPIFIMIYVMRTPLEQGNTITLDANREPVVHIRRSTYQSAEYKDKLEAMKKFSEDAVKVTEDVLRVDFLPDTAPSDQYFDHLGLGAGGHEMGSIPMGDTLCLDNDLKLRGHENVYVCDLSVFPYVAEANPSLTLTALALRLSHTLVPPVPAASATEVSVVNHSGASIRIAVSHHQNDTFLVGAPTGLAPGEFKSFPTTGTEEFVFVYKLDLSQNQTPNPAYLHVPEFYVGKTGKVLVID